MDATYQMYLKNGTRFDLDEDGVVLDRTDGPRGWSYSGKWIVTGIKTRHHSLDRITLAQAADGADIGHGVVCDIDHGTHRQWGNRGRQVRRIVRVGTAADALAESTQAEYDRYLAAGCTAMTLDEYRAACLAIGYRLDTDRRTTCAMGPYTNRHNARHYLAFGVSYTHIATGAGFANIAATRETLPALQTLRRNTVILHEGRLVEL